MKGKTGRDPKARTPWKWKNLFIFIQCFQVLYPSIKKHMQYFRRVILTCFSKQTLVSLLILYDSVHKINQLAWSCIAISHTLRRQAKNGGKYACKFQSLKFAFFLMFLQTVHCNVTQGPNDYKDKQGSILFLS